MYGVYINFCNPFGKHFIGSSKTIAGIRELVKSETAIDINIKNIETALILTDSFFHKDVTGTWIVIQKIVHKSILNRKPI